MKAEFHYSNFCNFHITFVSKKSVAVDLSWMQHGEVMGSEPSQHIERVYRVREKSAISCVMWVLL